MTQRPNLEYPECPNCGSDDTIRIGNAPVSEDDYEAESGVFRCGFCRNEYQFLKPKPVVEQVFSPKACCPHCKSFRTQMVKTGIDKRYHVCLSPGCNKSFKTLRPEGERLSRQSELQRQSKIR